MLLQIHIVVSLLSLILAGSSLLVNIFKNSSSPKFLRSAYLAAFGVTGLSGIGLIFNGASLGRVCAEMMILAVVYSVVMSLDYNKAQAQQNA